MGRRLCGATLLLLCTSLVFGLTRLPAQEETVHHPILVAVKKNWIETPKDQEDRPTRVTILGTTCNASVLLAATVEYKENPPGFVFEYTKYITINGHGNPDACLELDVPDIDTSFDLTFAPSSNPDEISFTGKIHPACKECTPKKGKSIAGTLRKARGGRYQLSFDGDLADTLELAEKD